MKKHTLLTTLFAAAMLGGLAPQAAMASDCRAGDKCIFVFGNSITHHLPNKNLGWYGDWGMAASDSSQDFVSQLAKMMTDKSGTPWKADTISGVDLEQGPATFKLSERAQQLAQKADIVVVELGDNFHDTPVTPAAAFADAYAKTLAALRPANGKLMCVSTWWVSAPKNKIIADACQAAGGTYVDISGLQAVAANMAGSEQRIANKGVAAHPGDKGMRQIAERIFKAVKP
ncbi:SGNH/GDSL hydrolase family protein [Duganella sp. sic0402]|uniref:SGNH/GDSL hydrolase family protein n=1 Tax=Duganella sp. sic0402 TaxID=2854786 RepID=UPI001C4844C2|nr:SGNH/GDSL hydrolase family protein [Duganella sp. sic0402]MBV7535961.1 SGNH/GDSL hydrolase family protein [Duganella sp. sic0402]